MTKRFLSRLSKNRKLANKEETQDGFVSEIWIEEHLKMRQKEKRLWLNTMSN